ncbi:nickel transporter permease [Halorussus halobius]|uniref:nickel transporter permease n=1 Tax=Halorussus halobius TaxID=1710537 RepID=UPI001091E769|nr:nickel transporter permease [Halorussus halobius]
MSTEQQPRGDQTRHDSSDAGAAPASPADPKRRAVRTILRNRGGLFGTAIIALVVGVAAFAAVDNFLLDRAVISALYHDPRALDATARLSGPSAAHPLGTDNLGRDVLSRIVYGTRVSLQVGLLAVSISVVVGTAFGIVAGYFGGVVDDAIMRFVDVLLAFPGIILAIAVAGALGPSIRNVIIALAIQGWVTYARLIRGEVLSVREREYVKAARSIGASDRQIIVGDILPNTIYPVIVQATLSLGGIIIAEAGLSFLGLGPQPPTASWGMMLSTGRSYIQSAWWLSLFPGVAIFITVMGFNLFGDVLRDVLDPRESTSQGGSM